MSKQIASRTARAPEDMELDPQCRAVGGWRGPMAVARPSQDGVTGRAVDHADQVTVV